MKHMLLLICVKHFKRFVEVIDDGLIHRVCSLNNDANVVINFLVADATEEDGKLARAVIFLKPALEQQDRAVPFRSAHYHSRAMTLGIDAIQFFITPFEPSLFLCY